MGSIASVIAMGAGIVQQAFGMGQQYQSMKMQQQIMRQQYAQVQQHCPDGSVGTIQTLNGQQVLVCSPTSGQTR